LVAIDDGVRRDEEDARDNRMKEQRMVMSEDIDTIKKEHILNSKVANQQRKADLSIDRVAAQSGGCPN
jgi:hypothetical protein